ncbi:MAG: DUF4397 domain-containing protein [Woeseiaceae bacterium]|nr:DUF4397 domain-containing protein [Woeseiaceae bacterium]
MMKRTAKLAALAAALILCACGESNLPVATGEASIRAISAMQSSPDLVFLIEERSLGNLAFRASTAVQSFDDLEYTFSFDVFFAGNTVLTRIASQYIDFVANQEYTLLISGTVANPTLTLWESTEREFATGATVFQVRFAQTSNYFTAPIDYYIAPAGVPPARGEAVATVSFAEIAIAQDFEAGSYVVTITSANNPSDILFTSDETDFTAQSDVIISTFDATVNEISEFNVHLLGAQGGTARLFDSSVPASVEFLHAAMDLGTSDIYDDESLLSQVLADHAFTELSPAIQMTPGDKTFRYVLAGGTAITLEGDLGAFPSFRYRFISAGVDTAFVTLAMLPDRQPIDTAAKVSFFQTSNNYPNLNLYLVEQGETIDGKFPIRFAFPSLAIAPANEVRPGDYDAYVTNVGETDILAGPVNVNLALGDVVEMVIFDTADPAILDLQLFESP